MTDSQQKLAFEDIVPGLVVVTPPYVVSLEEIIQFARNYDPQPFHLDSQAAAAGIFGKLCASGWHSCAIIMRLVAENFLNQTTSLGSPGIERLRWVKPVYPGDSLYAKVSINSSKLSNSRPGIGIVHALWEGYNQANELVLDFNCAAFFGRRLAEK